MLVYWFTGQAGDDTFYNQTASRKAQYLTQPPTTTAMMEVYEVKKYGSERAQHVDCTLHDPLGLKIGLLVDIASTMISRNEHGVEVFVHLLMPLRQTH